jgi:hypothetical protein
MSSISLALRSGLDSHAHDGIRRARWFPLIVRPSQQRRFAQNTYDCSAVTKIRAQPLARCARESFEGMLILVRARWAEPLLVCLKIVYSELNKIKCLSWPYAAASGENRIRNRSESGIPPRESRIRPPGIRFQFVRSRQIPTQSSHRAGRRTWSGFAPRRGRYQRVASETEAARPMIDGARSVRHRPDHICERAGMTVKATTPFRLIFSVKGVWADHLE